MGGGAECPQVPLIKGNLNSPPCSYLRTGACLSSMAAWCNELHSRTLDALQDDPCRAIMSTLAHQFMLPELPFHKYCVGTCCPPKSLCGGFIYFISHSEVTRSLRTLTPDPATHGMNDGPQASISRRQSCRTLTGHKNTRMACWAKRGCLKSLGGVGER